MAAGMAAGIAAGMAAAGMADRLEDLLRGCTVRILGGPMPGAGFFVAPGTVATCVHVIGDSTSLVARWERDGADATELAVTGPPLILASRGRPIPALDRDYPDIAILHVEAPDGHPCVRMDPQRPSHGDRLVVFGYPQEGGAVHLTPAGLTYRGSHGVSPRSFWDLGADTVKPGMSGAAVLNLRTGRVGGIIVASKNPARADGALAVPWHEVEQDLAAVLAANRAFHETDHRWNDAARAAAPEAVPDGHASSMAIQGSQGLQSGSGNVQYNFFGGFGETVPAPGPAAPPGPEVTVTIEATLTANGMLDALVRLGEARLCERQGPLPPEIAEVWGALALPGLIAADRMANAGRKLAGALLDDEGQARLATVFRHLPPASTAEVVLVADGPALSLPVELIRLSGNGTETGPLGLLANVSVMRRIAGAPPGAAPAPTPGPLKILVAVAAPDETKTPNAPLNVEQEMDAVLRAVSGVVEESHAQVRILEVASLAAIRQALADDYHVLHLSAHGSPDSVELEDEDGGPVRVTSDDLMQALKHAGRRVPLIVLSSCSGGATGSAAMAAGLLRNGADRVIAMLAPVTDRYATLLARSLYHELAIHPATTVGVALSRARREADDAMRGTSGIVSRPEYGIGTLLASRGDGHLVDPALAEAPLRVATTPPTERGVRELPLGALIGRRPQLRDAMGALRRTERARERFGAASGVVLTGVGGIGKTALAGRIISRLRDDGWLIAVHEGRWNPAVLIAAVAQAIASVPALQEFQRFLTDRGIDDGPKLDVVRQLLGGIRLLLVLDDFEQNLTAGGDAFLDPPVDSAITALAEAAETGALLITCRYPLPGDNRYLVPIAIPPLSAAELRRMFLRLPALRDLDADDRRLLMRTIGGHPRLIEFTDALMRGGSADFRHIQRKLNALAVRQRVSLAHDTPLGTALDQAMLLGSADILLEELLTLLTPRQQAILHQVAVCYGAMTLDDLSFALADGIESPNSGLSGLRADVNRLTDLTLLSPGPDVGMHPWTAALVTRAAAGDGTALHERAPAMRFRRFEQGRGTYDDLVDIPRHLAALGRYNEIPDVADAALRILSGTLATCAYLAEIRSLVPETDRAWCVIGDKEVPMLLQAGDLSSADGLLQAMHDQLKGRADADPRNTQRQRDLSISHDELGNLATATGDLTTARTAYQASLNIRQQLTTADPRNTQRQRDLSISHDKLGNLATATGDLTTARTAYQAGLDIAQQLADADPRNTQWQRDLSISHNKIGDVARAEGDLAAARNEYQVSFDIFARLADLDPLNAQWRSDLEIARERLDNLDQSAEGQA
jgi:tetratricopeptide (TPR) repeat protein